jgi:putative ABC transport system ATP-binding protein
MSEAAVPTIDCSGLTRVYGKDGSESLVRALDHVDLTIAPGESISVEGPSGCGKTTLLNIIGLLDTPTEGEVRWDGRPVGQRSERERARLRLTGVGFIFQRFYLLPTLTAQENVELPMRALGRPATDRQRRARELLDEVGLGTRYRAYPHELSGGEEQRVAIARALANEPGILLADEPTGELDSQNTVQVLDRLMAARARRGSSLILVTHNPAVARRAERHVVMADGRIVSDARGA